MESEADFLAYKMAFDRVSHSLGVVPITMTPGQEEKLAVICTPNELRTKIVSYGFDDIHTNIYRKGSLAIVELIAAKPVLSFERFAQAAITLMIAKQEYINVRSMFLDYMTSAVPLYRQEGSVMAALKFAVCRSCEDTGPEVSPFLLMSLDTGLKTDAGKYFQQLYK